MFHMWLEREDGPQTLHIFQSKWLAKASSREVNGLNDMVADCPDCIEPEGLNTCFHRESQSTRDLEEPILSSDAGGGGLGFCKSRAAIESSLKEDLKDLKEAFIGDCLDTRVALIVPENVLEIGKAILSVRNIAARNVLESVSQSDAGHALYDRGGAEQHASRTSVSSAASGSRDQCSFWRL